MRANVRPWVLALIAVVGITHAQTKLNSNPMPQPEYSVTEVAQLLAGEFDAIMVPCIVQLEPSSACYEIDDSQDHHKWRLDTFVSGLNDAVWANPWTRGDTGFLTRVLWLDNGDAYQFFLVEQAPFETLVYVYWLGRF